MDTKVMLRVSAKYDPKVTPRLPDANSMLTAGIELCVYEIQTTQREDPEPQGYSKVFIEAAPQNVSN